MMETNFSAPKRQSAMGVLIMFLSHLQHSIRALIIPILVLVIKSKSITQGYILFGILLFLITLAIYSYLSYLKFTFFLDEEKQEFIIQKGIFNRENLIIRLDKIQQVNINQSLIQRIVGVYSLEIDTAGSDKKEASIKAIDHQSATILREKLLARTYQTANGHSHTEQSNLSEPDHIGADVNEPVSQSRNIQPLLKLSSSSLLKIGLTSNYGASIALLTGFIFAIIEATRNYTEAFQLEQNPISQLSTKGLGLISLCILLVIALLIVLGTNLIRTFVKYFDFEIRREKNFLSINSGLFDKKHTLLKPARVQISSYSQNYFQKKLNLINLRFKQAAFSTAAEADQDNKKHDIEIPGCDEKERNEILKMIYNQLPVQGKLFIPNYRFLFLMVMLRIVIPALVFSGIATSYPPLREYLYWIIPYAILVGIGLYFEYAHHRLYVSEEFIIKKSGIWDIEYQTLEPHKIQKITTKQYFWHKKADIGHLILHTAAGTLHFKYGKYADIHRMVNYWLYKVESGKKDWM
ncbi:PH domain-containing protein [Pedobacter gandavensis]|uniref:PH domain-containing protein n=1 Tax=Pedobacter gandavensis TaxID=2679963 RepID=A0ABR6F132_9SPHI|nr:PH domain-containing protein [Pedobacter gandavensis]MBB2150734.1 PH domain-containing protein [Pedobacter gandavensis]